MCSILSAGSSLCCGQLRCTVTSASRVVVVWKGLYPATAASQWRCQKNLLLMQAHQRDPLKWLTTIPSPCRGRSYLKSILSTTSWSAQPAFLQSTGWVVCEAGADPAPNWPGEGLCSGHGWSKGLDAMATGLGGLLLAAQEGLALQGKALGAALGFLTCANRNIS